MGFDEQPAAVKATAAINAIALGRKGVMREIGAECMSRPGRYSS